MTSAIRRATIITDEGGMLCGVVVRQPAGRQHPPSLARITACLRISEWDGDLTTADASALLDRCIPEVGVWRWVPRDDGGGRRPHIEPAEPGSRGGFCAMVWSWL